MEPNLQLTFNDEDLLHDASYIVCLVGCLIYLTITRLDIIFLVQTFSQFMANPRQPHLDATHCLLWYIKQSPSQGILLSSSSTLQLHAFYDFDWATCP